MILTPPSVLMALAASAMVTCAPFPSEGSETHQPQTASQTVSQTSSQSLGSDLISPGLFFSFAD